MKIVVLNGSPKGDASITMQYVHFIAKHFPQHEYSFINIANDIKQIENIEDKFFGLIGNISRADFIFWAFPVYFYVVSAQYKRFIELIFEKKATNAFRDKYTAVITTSIHVFDHAAVNYIHSICDDLNMKYTGAYTAFMYDLLSDKERERLIKFADDVFTTAGSSSVTSRTFSSLVGSSFKYKPGKPDSKISTEGKRILIITDNDGEQTNLSAMTERFKEAFADNIEVVNLRNIDIRGGCLGCLNCCYDYTCVYKAQDGYIEFFNTKVKPADVLVFAGAIKDRYLSSLMKCYFDRTFFNGITPTMKGKQFGFIISGRLRQISNLRQILEAFFEVQQGNVVDIITDEAEDSDAIDKGLQSLAVRLIRLAKAEYVKPGTFFRQGVGKIIRDETWGNQRFVHPADHRYYKKQGLYNFPQKQYKTRFRNLMMMTLMKIPAFRKEMYKRLKAEMIKPLKNVVETK